MKRIGVSGFNSTPGLSLLWSWLSDTFATEFVTSFSNHEPWDGWIGNGSIDIAVSNYQAPGLIYSPRRGSTVKATPRQVQFVDSDPTPAIFRGREIQQKMEADFTALNGAGTDATIMTIDGCPVWVRRNDSASPVDIVGYSLPEPQSGESLGDIFHQGNFVGLLPLIEFLRKITGHYEWTQPATTACFMFDDPNLHAGSYGFINYKALVREATQHNYHVTLATVPLDTWYTNAPTAAFFATHENRLSLLIHGNDHVRNELARDEPDTARLARLAQALRRIDRLETKTGVKVSRVMAPPHGACCAESMRAMANLGFEGACVSHGSLRAWNKGADWTGALGLRPSVMIEDLPVVPRFRMALDCQPAILLAAYLGQPIIPVGHHQDVRGGLELLRDLADFINSLPGIQWSDMTTVLRSNFRIKPVSEDKLVVSISSRQVRFQIPRGVRSLQLDTSWNRSSSERIEITIDSVKRRFNTFDNGVPLPVREGEQATITIQRPPPNSTTIPAPRIHLWPVARRFIAEARDRLQPFRPRR